MLKREREPKCLTWGIIVEEGPEETARAVGLGGEGAEAEAALPFSSVLKPPPPHTHKTSLLSSCGCSFLLKKAPVLCPPRPRAVF